MSVSAWDVFAASAAPPPPAADPQRRATQAVLGNQAGRAWLAARLAHEQARPAWQPGMTIDAVAFAEGRRAMLRDLLAEITIHPQETA